MEDFLNDIPSPDLLAAINDISLPVMPDITLNDHPKDKADIFKLESRKSWDKTEEARCDFSYKPRLTHRAGFFFFSIWQKSVFGRTLTDIKTDDDMVPFFVKNMAPFIRECVGCHLDNGSWAVVTTPMRRHLTHNFASRIAEELTKEIGVPFYFDCARCRSRQRVSVVFEPNNIPREPNVIVFDDFVTTGSTMHAMKALLEEHDKNCVLFAAINNKI